MRRRAGKRVDAEQESEVTRGQKAGEQKSKGQAGKPETTKKADNTKKIIHGKGQYMKKTGKGGKQ